MQIRCVPLAVGSLQQLSNTKTTGVLLLEPSSLCPVVPDSWMIIPTAWVSQDGICLGLIPEAPNLRPCPTSPALEWIDKFSHVNKSSAWAAAPLQFPTPYSLHMPHGSVCLFRGLFRKVTKRTSEPPLSATATMQQNRAGIAYINSCRLIFVISSLICLWSLQRQIQEQIPRDGHLVCTEINTREGERTVLVTLCGRALASQCIWGHGGMAAIRARWVGAARCAHNWEDAHKHIQRITKFR